MPTRARRNCSTPGCSGSVKDGRCALCRRRADKARGTATSRGYTSKDWKAKRDAFLEAHPTCQRKGCTRRAKHVDHVIPKKRGGRDDESNFEALCHPHHSQKTAKENTFGGDNT